jgi:FAD/FMN-containing dehydrogenase
MDEGEDMSHEAMTDRAPAQLPTGALERLRTELRGLVFEPSEPAAATVRSAFNAMHEGNPAITVCCADSGDVIAGVRFAREHGLELAVRGGGHSVAGLSTIDGGVLLDLAMMRAGPG